MANSKTKKFEEYIKALLECPKEIFGSFRASKLANMRPSEKHQKWSASFSDSEALESVELGQTNNQKLCNQTRSTLKSIKQAAIRFYNVLRPILEFIGSWIGMLLLIGMFLCFVMISYDYVLGVLELDGVEIPEKYFIFNREEFNKAMSYSCWCW